MSSLTHSPTLADAMRAATGSTPLDCYQCGRCAAGCPQNVPGEMDISPTRVMRLLQLAVTFPERAQAYSQQALNSETPWLCAGCQSCTTRCPQGLDIAGAMDVLREEGLKRSITAPTRRVREIQALHHTFVDGARGNGRIQELFLTIGYMLRTGHFNQDAQGNVMRDA